MSKSCRLPDYADYHFPFREGTLALLEGASLVAVSYTHLTLPTIYSV